MQSRFLENVAMYIGWKAPCKCTQASILQHKAGQSKSRAKAKAEEQNKKRNITSLGEPTFICRAPFLAFSFLFSLSPMSQCQSKSLMQLRATNSKQQTNATNIICGRSPKKSMKALMPLTIYGCYYHHASPLISLFWFNGPKFPMSSSTSPKYQWNLLESNGTLKNPLTSDWLQSNRFELNPI